MKPILFNTEMTSAILDGQKTVTRRVVKKRGWKITGRPKWGDKDGKGFWFDIANEKSATTTLIEPPYQPGDILYVRETWNTNPLSIYEYGDEPNKYVYKADYDGHGGEFGWRPSIHMPKEAARIFLRVTGIRMERLQEINALGASREGQPSCYGLTICGGPAGCPMCEAEPDNAVEWFSKIWDRTIKSADRALYGWEANPWVWRIEFDRIEKPKG